MPNPNTWRCSLHGVEGATGDDSLERHQDEEHGGKQITVMFRHVPQEGDHADQA